MNRNAVEKWTKIYYETVNDNAQKIATGEVKPSAAFLYGKELAKKLTGHNTQKPPPPPPQR